MSARRRVQEADARVRDAQIDVIVAELKLLSFEIDEHEPGRGRFARDLVDAWKSDEADRALERDLQ